MTSVIVVRSRAVARGVKALDTNLRSRWCSSPSRLIRFSRNPVPQRPRGNALRGEEHPLGYPKPWVAQDGVDEFVGQQLRPVWPDRDGRLLACAADNGVGLVGVSACP